MPLFPRRVTRPWALQIGRDLSFANVESGRRLLFALLAIDGVFFLLHLLFQLEVIGNNMFTLNTDGSYAERFQYLKLALATLATGGLAWRRAAPRYLPWASLFLLTLADDALRLHERGGMWIAELLPSTEHYGVTPQDVGELAMFATYGLVIIVVAMLTVAQWQHRFGRRFARVGLLLLIGFGVCGAVFDVFHALSVEVGGPRWLNGLLTLAEDGGEHLVASALVTWCVVCWRRGSLGVAPID